MCHNCNEKTVIGKLEPHNEIREYTIDHGDTELSSRYAAAIVFAVNRELETPSIHAYDFWATIGMKWIEDREGGYRGKLTVRIGRYVKQKTGKKLSTDTLAKIGNLYREGTSGKANYFVDWTRRIDWEDGDFGDSGSCYWGGREYAREMLRDNGAYAVRLWELGEDGYTKDNCHGDTFTGTGRIWISEVKPGVWIAWNCYHSPSNADKLDLMDFCNLLADANGLTTKRIRLRNNGETDGTLYINSGSGVVISDESKIDSIGNSYDLHWDDDSRHCCQCGCSINEDDARCDDNGNDYCDSCYCDTFTCCERCGCEVALDDGLCIDGNYYCCEHCAERAGYVQCAECEDWHNEDDTILVEDNTYCCDTCAERAGCLECADCGEWYDASADNADACYCADCAEIKAEHTLRESGELVRFDELGRMSVCRQYYSSPDQLTLPMLSYRTDTDRTTFVDHVPLSAIAVG